MSVCDPYPAGGYSESDNWKFLRTVNVLDATRWWEDEIGSSNGISENIIATI